MLVVDGERQDVVVMREYSINYRNNLFRGVGRDFHVKYKGVGMGLLGSI